MRHLRAVDVFEAGGYGCALVEGGEEGAGAAFCRGRGGFVVEVVGWWWGRRRRRAACAGGRRSGSGSRCGGS